MPTYNQRRQAVREALARQNKRILNRLEQERQAREQAAEDKYEKQKTFLKYCY